MKILAVSLLLGLVGIGVWYSPAYACKNCSAPGAHGLEKTSVDVPANCTLSSNEFPGRISEIEAIFSRREEVRELEDGYAFRFPGDERELATRLATWIIAERQCCSFFDFELTFAPELGPIWLSVKGSPEVKSLVASMMDTSIDAPKGN